MLKATFGHISFSIIDRWSEITLDKFIRLSEIEMPDKLVKLYNLSAKLASCEKSEFETVQKEWDQVNDSITFEDNVKNFPEYYGKVIELFSTISSDGLDFLSSEIREQLYSTILKPFVLSMLYINPLDINRKGELKPYTPASMDSFIMNDVKYCFPKTISVLGQKVYFSQEPIVSFVEACDIDISTNGLINEGIKKLPLFMAVYCRPEGEKYNEQKTFERVDLFKSVSMDIVWSLFFCIGRFTKTYLKDLRLFFQAMDQKVNQVPELILE
jgi:hypothetical protein